MTSAMTQRTPSSTPALRRVLATTDMSSLGNQAISYARALAQPGGEVRLVHVVHPRALADGQFDPEVMVSDEHARHVEALERRLQELLPADSPSAGTTATAGVVENEDTIAGVCQEADRFDADVIVIASHGWSGLAGAVLGSVAHGLMRRSHRPVLVVRASSAS